MHRIVFLLNLPFSMRSKDLAQGLERERGICTLRQHFVGCRPNQWIELTALEHRGSARKGKEEFALSGLGKRLLAAAHLGR
jgi:hypothetical protein